MNEQIFDGYPLSPQQERFRGPAHQREVILSESDPTPIKREMPKPLYVFPLSFEQQRLWFLEQLNPGAPIFNVSTAIGISGSLNAPLLEQSFNEIISRHEILRTTFGEVEGKVAQIVSSFYKFTLSLIDLRNISGRAKEDDVQRVLGRVSREPFILTQGPLLRLFLLRLSASEYILFLNIHHIICDGWSAEILLREAITLYDDLLQNRPSSLPMLTIQYADYSVWQREWLEGEALSEQLGYWRRHLEGVEPLELSTDRPRPAVPSYRGGRESLAINRELAEALRELSRREGMTMFMLLLGVFRILLYRCSGQEQIAVGTPIAGRNRFELEPLIGFFVNMLAIKSELSGDLTVEEVIRREREAALGAYAHQDAPFEKVVEELKPPRDLGRHPIFQVIFALRNTTENWMSLRGLRAREVEIASTTIRFDLSLLIIERSGETISQMSYSKDLFDANGIRRMLASLKALLESVAVDVKQRVSEIEIVSLEEKNQILYEWNETRAEYGKEKCIHELFQEQVGKTPDAIAVACEGEQVSYREVNRRADRLAERLIGSGMEVESPVAVCLERSPATIVAIFGVLKSGGVYVPLDPSYPKARLIYMLDEALPYAVVSQQRLLPLLTEAKAMVLCVEDLELEQSPKGKADENIGRIGSGNLAYIVYTSGSTGIPKKVMVQHDSAVNLATWLDEYIYKKSRSPLRVGVNASFSFDASIKQILQIISGRTLVITPENVRSGGEELLTYIREQQIDAIDITPSQLSALLSERGEEEIAANLEILLVGGEAIDVNLWERLKKLKLARVYNVYGPSECTVDATSYCVRAGSAGPTIGRAISNMEAIILNNGERMAPIGVEGELCLSGVGVARGYYAQPELTSERFIPNPYSKREGERLYRTGDFGRWLEGGNIEFLGRRDGQVKIRGYRIELGEIESALREAVGVKQAAVVVREYQDGDKRPVAYVVMRAGEEGKVSELRAYLKERLPEYMAPGAYVRLERLPLTANGKVDKGALPTEKVEREGDEGYQGPRTEIEEELAGIWRQVLRVERVGIEDNFFELGGHSLLATRMASRIREVFKIELPLRATFEEKSLAGLSRRVEAELRAGAGLRLPPIERVSKERDVEIEQLYERLDEFTGEEVDLALRTMLKDGFDA